VNLPRKRVIGSLLQVIAWGGISLWSYIHERGSLETFGVIGMFLISVFIFVLDIKLSKQLPIQTETLPVCD
jgi:hypothetical protein